MFAGVRHPARSLSNHRRLWKDLTRASRCGLTCEEESAVTPQGRWGADNNGPRGVGSVFRPSRRTRGVAPRNHCLGGTLVQGARSLGTYTLNRHRPRGASPWEVFNDCVAST